ncbi:MSHA biogenesis protein MshJ [Marinobacter alexandrii]|jgi:MSHA biogenesis protein MshJ|uniref:MSHA biogenesis protein MshJ n=1 Tax=Marinobacter alexandrii TaxID=2570351 RepID=UPI0011085825|nr:MSHA biogenesis protein MshJ [Marinobacter alexandrii]
MATSWRDSLQTGANLFNERPIRERVLVTVTLLVLVLFIGWELAITPAMNQQDRLESRLGTLSASRDSLLAQQQDLANQLASDPTEALRDQLDMRQKRLARLDRQIADTTGKLIAPRAMVSLLKDMLAAQASLELQALELKTPTPVYGPDNGGAGAETTAAELEKEGGPLLYAHDVELSILGSYLEVLAYLKRLEGLDNRLGWVVFEYDAENWPAGEAVIRVRTLSLEPAWLGV